MSDEGYFCPICGERLVYVKSWQTTVTVHAYDCPKCGPFHLVGGVIKFTGTRLPPKANGQRKWPVAAAKRRAEA